MPDINLTSVAGKKEFYPTFASGTVEIAGGTTTDVVITPASDQRVKLTAIAAVSLQTNLTTISLGSTDVVTDVNLDQAGVNTADGEDELKIGFGYGNQEPILGGYGEALTFKTNVARSSVTKYTYQLG